MLNPLVFLSGFNRITMYWLTISNFKRISIFRRTAFIHVIEEIQQMSQCRYHIALRLYVCIRITTMDHAVVNNNLIR